MTNIVQHDLFSTLSADNHAPFKLGDREYAALPGSETPPDESIPVPTEHCLLMVIPTDPNITWSKDAFVGFLQDRMNEDDVSHANFENCLLFWASSPGSIELSEELTGYLRETGARVVIVEQVNDQLVPSNSSRGHSSRIIPGGPYLWAANRLLPVHRLYRDTHRTFVATLFSSDGIRNLNVIRLCDIELSRPPAALVAVPSRWRNASPMRAPGPLDGKRAVIKDIFDIRGLRVSACNRAYLQMSQPAYTTASMIQHLIDAGADVVGKAKLSSLISREEPSESIFVEYEVPENPRGDAMQSPAGSSSGSAAAVAAYEWLDFAIGSDSTGSARRPAMVNGCFAIRLSTNAFPYDGMMPCFPIFDSPAVFSRDIRELQNVTACWCGSYIDHFRTHFTSITMVSEYELQSRAQDSLFQEFVRDFASSLNLNIRHLCLCDLWAQSPPKAARENNLHEYLRDVGRFAFYYDFTHSTDDFRARYEQKYHSRPLANRTTTWRWEQAQSITRQQRDEAVQRLEIYKQWLLSIAFPDANPLVFLPIMKAEPNYRDEQKCSPLEAPDAWDQLWLSPILGAPEVTVPIGQIPYHSRMTDREEMLPVAASVMGLPGTDLALLDVVHQMLERTGRPSRVAAGRQMFYEDWEIVERR